MTLPKQPNILLIMADELVARLTGAYGHPVVKTPNLDALVRHGVRFDAAYSPSPLCAPARACLVSGMYTSTNRVYDNAAYFAADIPCAGHYLTNAGYDTVLSGKMHFVGADQLHGFRRRLTTDIYAEEFGMLQNRAPWSVARDPSLFDPEKGNGRHAQNYVGSNVHVGRWHHHLSYDEEAHFRGLEYIRSRVVFPNEPWFLCVSYHHPHEPFWPPQDVWDLYEGEEIEIPHYPDDMEERYSMMDRWLNANHGIRMFKEELRSPESLRRVRRAYYALVT
ncbi:MAG TPA: sulfatase-like hydrolase/transferase, partial [Chloroflexota bacterium]|nr:sulfatase-like hydrolase/transferase [Chloroflexota bacterium]